MLESNQPIDFPIECNIANLINGTPPISPGSLVKVFLLYFIFYNE